MSSSKKSSIPVPAAAAITPFSRYRDSYQSTVGAAVGLGPAALDHFTRVKAERLLAAAGRRLGPVAGQRWLDVGCGPALIHRLLAPAGIALTGVDVCAAMIERAAAENPGQCYQSYDGRRLPFDDSGFDLSFAICVVHHVPPAGWPGFLAELRRVTRPGGLIAVIEHNPFNPLTQLVVSRCEFDHDAVLVRAGTLARLVVAAGGREPEREFLLLTPWSHPWCQRLDRWCAGLPLAAQYCLTARA